MCRSQETAGGASPLLRFWGSTVHALDRYFEEIGVTAADVLVPSAIVSFGATFKAADDDGSVGPMKIKGVATTDHVDLQKETVDQDGINWAYFLKYGWFNDSHEKGVPGKVGFPEAVEKVTLPDGHKGHEVSGYLLNTAKGRAIWEVAQACEETGGKRRLTMSVQGPILKKSGPDGKTIAQLLVTEVAITGHGINKHTEVAPWTAKDLDAYLTQASKAMDAGHPVPDYEHGGSGAPLLRQDHDRTLRCVQGGKVMKVKMSSFKNVPGLGDVNGRAAFKQAMKDAGVDVDEDGDDEGERGEGEAAKSMDNVMGQVREWLEKGGAVKLLSDAEPDALSGAVDLTPVATAIKSGDEVLAAGLLAIGKVVGELSKSMETVQAQNDAMSAFLKIPAPRKAVVAGETVRKPAVDGEPDANAVGYQVARKSLEAVLAHEPTGSAKKVEAMRLMTAMEARYPVTKKDLDAAGIAVLA